MRSIITTIILCSTLAVSAPALSRGGPSEASAESVAITGSVIIVASTMPLLALESIFNGQVQNVKSNPDKTKDIEIKQQNNKTTVVRVPEKSAHDIQVGQKADFVADKNGHILKIENKPVAYLPGKSADGLIHSQTIK